MKRIKLALGVAAFGVLIFILPSRIDDPAKEFASFFTRPVLNLFTRLFRSWESWTRFPALEKENRNLRKKLGAIHRLAFEHRELELENQRLRELLEFKERVFPMVDKAMACQVIGRNPAGWREELIVDCGREDGIRLGSPILTSAGLVGKVSEISLHVSKIRLITHPRFRIGGIIQRTRHTGVIYGTADGECRMKYLALEADVRIGDLVETGGFTEGFPKGLLIGRVDAIWKEPGQIFKVASIKLAADLDRLEEVLCLVP